MEGERPPRSRRRSVARTGAAIALLAAVIGIGAGPVTGANGPAAVPNAWGWLVARDKDNPVGYVPDLQDQGNSGGHIDRVERVSPGSYKVYFDQIGNGFYPIGLVTAMSGAPLSCMIDDNFGNGVGDDPGLYVDCFDRTGQATDARFVANIVLGGDGPTGTLGYAWADQESVVDYATTDDYSYVSSGAGPITVHRSGTGSYEVTMPGLGRRGGHAQAAAAKGGPPALCNVASFVKDGSDERIAVRCRDVAGQLVDADFMVVFTHRVGLTGVKRPKAGYLLAERPKAASYTPEARYRYSSTDRSPTVKRTSKGRYRVTLPGMARGGSVQVNAFGAGPSICQVTSIRKDGLPQRVGVACFDPTGTPKDSRFLLSYSR